MFPPAKPLSERVCGSLKLLKLLKLGAPAASVGEFTVRVFPGVS
jgi:hypothetical protein